MAGGLRVYNVTELLGKSPSAPVLGNEGNLLYCMCVGNKKREKNLRFLLLLIFIGWQYLYEHAHKYVL